MDSNSLSRLLMRALQLAGLVVALAAAGPLRASDFSLNGGDFGLYGGMGYGVAILENPGSTGSLPRSPPEALAVQPATERLVATSMFGGYRLAPGLAVEGARLSFGTAMPATDNLLAAASERAAVWSVSSVGSVPLDSSLSLFARFGLSYPEGQGPSPSPAQLDELGRVYGLGLHFAPNERIDLRAELQRFTRVGSDGSTDASTVLFGARVRF